MKETKFIDQNKHKWNDFEGELRNDGKDPEKLSQLFIETTDDLSFSRTYYANRSVRVYLNDIAQQIFQKLYKTKTDKNKGFAALWKYHLPKAMWDNRRSLWWASGLFLLGMLIAVISSIYNPDFAEIIMGQGYIDMTLENIDNGDPMGVYGDSSPGEMFLAIALNNIRVSFNVFIFGLLVGVGTIFMLLRNAIMVGAFLYFFYERSLMEDAFYAVMLHGTLELSMIILASMAGLVLAKGLVFPKSYSRLQSFVKHARQGILIMIGVSVFLVLAAFIESYMTRHTEISNLIRGLVIFGSFALVISYFVIYPYLLHRAGKFVGDEEDELLQERLVSIDTTAIKSSGIIFTEVFYYFKKNFKSHIRLAIAIGIIGTASILNIVGIDSFLYFIVDPFSIYDSGLWFFDIIWPWNEINNIFRFDLYTLLYPLLVLLFATLLFSTAFLKRKLEDSSQKLKKNFGKHLFSAIFTSMIILIPFFLPRDSAFLTLFTSLIFLMFIAPIFMMTYTISSTDDINWFKSFRRTGKIIKGNYGKLLSSSLFLISMPWIVSISCSSILWNYISEIITLNINSESELVLIIPYVVYTFVILFILALCLPLYIYGFNLLYSTLEEINEAHYLKKRIQNIRFRKRAYGIEQE